MVERNKESLVVFVVLFIITDYVKGDVYYNFVNREDPCVALCDKTPLSFTDVSSKILLSCLLYYHGYSIIIVYTMLYSLIIDNIYHIRYKKQSNYAKSCCQRGCTFFNLVDLRHGLEPDSLNGTRDACEACE